MSHSRKVSDAPSLQHDPTELQNLVATIHTHSRLASVRFQNFWYYTDRSTKMAIAKRFLRTKQMLIILTSCLFIFGTIWFGSHPDVRHQEDRPIIRRIPTIVVRQPFPDHSALLSRFGLIEEEEMKQKKFDETNMEDILNPRVGWDIFLPHWANLSSPVIVTALFDSKDFEQVLKLIWSVKEFAEDSHLAIFDMTDGKVERKQRSQQNEFSNIQSVETYCNLTEVCSVHDTLFNEQGIDKYLRKHEFGAYKPILIQRMLELFPLALWLDSNKVISSREALQAIWNRTQRQDITTFRLSNGCSVSSYTFKKMLPFFGLDTGGVKFEHMIESSSYAFKRSERVDKLMRLWLNCSLTEHCIKPIGVDPRDCPSRSCIDNLPTFGYLGCHKYETSALCASLVSQGHKGKDAPNKVYRELINTMNTDTMNNLNMTAIKIGISYERNRMLKLNNRVKVNSLEDSDMMSEWDTKDRH